MTAPDGPGQDSRLSNAPPIRTSWAPARTAEDLRKSKEVPPWGSPAQPPVWQGAAIHPGAPGPSTGGRRALWATVAAAVALGLLAFVLVTQPWDQRAEARSGRQPRTSSASSTPTPTAPPSRTTPDSTLADELFKHEHYLVQGHGLTMVVTAGSSCSAATGLAWADDILADSVTCSGVALSRAVLDDGSAVVDTYVVQTASSEDAADLAAALTAASGHAAPGPPSDVLDVTPPAGFDAAFSALSTAQPRASLFSTGTLVLLQRSVPATGQPLVADAGEQFEIRVPSSGNYSSYGPEQLATYLSKVIVVDVEMAKLFS